MALRFGTAGIPAFAKGVGTVKGVEAVREIGLDAMELEFNHSVNVSEELSPEVRESAENNGVRLTCHAQYYINLNALEKNKLEASKQRLIRAAHVANLCGATSVAFHPGFYLKSTKEEAYLKVRDSLNQVVENLRQTGNKIWLRPETTGKHSQFGNLDEVLRLSQELEQVQPCIDYAHMRARENRNNAKEFSAILEATEKALGRKALNDMHIQFSGVNFSEKGELNHLQLKDSDLNFQAMADSWKEFNIGGIVISESPNLEKDALLLKRICSKWIS